MLVRNLMTRKVDTLNVTDTLLVAEDIMNLGDIRHLPVVHGDRLVGIVSQRDILRASLSSLIEHKSEDSTAFRSTVSVAEIMTAPVITASPDLPVSEAAQMMAEYKIGCLPVVEERDKLLGLVTETDLLHYFVRGSKRRRKVKR